MIQGIEVEQKAMKLIDGSEDGALQRKEERIIKIKFIDRLKNLELIGKHKAVDAFVQQKASADVNVNLAEELGRRLDESRTAFLLRAGRGWFLAWRRGRRTSHLAKSDDGYEADAKKGKRSRLGDGDWRSEEAVVCAAAKIANDLPRIVDTEG